MVYTDSPGVGPRTVHDSEPMSNNSADAHTDHSTIRVYTWPHIGYDCTNFAWQVHVYVFATCNNFTQEKSDKAWSFLTSFQQSYRSEVPWREFCERSIADDLDGNLLSALRSNSNKVDIDDQKVQELVKTN